MATFRELLTADPIDLDAVEAHLNGLSHAQRVEQMRQVPGKLQRKLFAAANGRGALEPTYFVPDSVEDRKWVRHEGKNSLPAFSSFAKVFTRPAKGEALWGYNDSPVGWLVGPGHYILRDGPQDGEMHVDYYSIPPEQVDGAPPLKPNDSGISTLVYGNMTDTLRRVSEHVTIGRAVKHGKDTENYFLLTREDV
jgi:hypothetical protein